MPVMQEKSSAASSSRALLFSMPRSPTKGTRSQRKRFATLLLGIRSDRPGEDPQKAFGVASERARFDETKAQASRSLDEKEVFLFRRCGEGGEDLLRDPADRLLGVFYGERFVSLDVLRFSEKAHRAFESHSSPGDERLPLETEISSVTPDGFEPVCGGDAETFHGRSPAFHFRKHRSFLSSAPGAEFCAPLPGRVPFGLGVPEKTEVRRRFSAKIPRECALFMC